MIMVMMLMVMMMIMIVYWLVLLLCCADVDVERPDEKSIMTYVAQFLKAYPDAGDVSCCSMLSSKCYFSSLT